jgi:hypothetical protein
MNFDSHNIEMVICWQCKGEGEISTHIMTDHHRNDYRVEYKECFDCDGAGRVQKRTIVTYKKLGEEFDD